MKTKSRFAFAGVCILTLALGIFSCDSQTDSIVPEETASRKSDFSARQEPVKTFQPEDIANIKRLLQSLDPASYRVVLPVFDSRRRTVGSQTYGGFPITEVRRIASVRNIKYSDSGNLQAIFQNCNGGGAGSHTESGSGAKAIDVVFQIEKITQNLDKNQYVLIK
ncbi:hypothetical protein [Dyadobacter sp. NIV53]|uniref:hypothetical protein n=1 Tax=Dyadobacter sp. NIV53 TaxID=2861765 RepID=UPI001C88840E|nr:hypothetical protein [Dyadobacter sp. NIV53]